MENTIIKLDNPNLATIKEAQTVLVDGVQKLADAWRQQDANSKEAKGKREEVSGTITDAIREIAKVAAENGITPAYTAAAIAPDLAMLGVKAGSIKGFSRAAAGMVHLLSQNQDISSTTVKQAQDAIASPETQLLNDWRKVLRQFVAGMDASEVRQVVEYARDTMKVTPKGEPAYPVTPEEVQQEKAQAA